MALDDALKALAAIDPRAESGGGTAVLWRPERGRDRRRVEGLNRDRDARLEAGQLRAMNGEKQHEAGTMAAR